MTGLWSLLLGSALAGSVHTGLPVTGVEGLGAAHFLAPDEGWTAPVDGGFVKVYVGRAEADAAEWVHRQAALLVHPAAPLTGLGDEAWGDGDGLALFRDGNVGVLVRTSTGARATAERLRAALVDGGPAWPRPGAVVKTGETWNLPVDQGFSVSFSGGALANQAGWTFTALPDEIFLWDPWGRPVAVSMPR